MKKMMRMMSIFVIVVASHSSSSRDINQNSKYLLRLLHTFLSLFDVRESLQQQLSSYFEQYESLELYCYELQNELKETKEAFQYKLASYHRLKRTNKMLDHLASDRLSALSALRHVTTVRDSRSFYLMIVSPSLSL